MTHFIYQQVYAEQTETLKCYMMMTASFGKCQLSHADQHMRIPGGACHVFNSALMHESEKQAQRLVTHIMAACKELALPTLLLIRCCYHRSEVAMNMSLAPAMSRTSHMHVSIGTASK